MNPSDPAREAWRVAEIGETAAACSSARGLEPVQAADIPFVVRIGSRTQQCELLVAAATWLAGVFFFLHWWIEPAHMTSPAAFAINTAVVAVDLILMPAWFFFFITRMRRPNPDIPLPSLRAAMVVTKAPSEPWPVVRETLLGMLDQDYPLPYDVWLADEDPSDTVVKWCQRHGVAISTRHGLAEYHRPRWPRRTRSKEGNLAYFYDTYGYDGYAVVAQMDADHVPEPDYLRHMVAPFGHATVGYVAAPSISDRNAHRSWSARARLFAEAPLHGPNQAGCSARYAPSCIGSHYAVRTEALRQIGGLGPELAEDFSTTLAMNAEGWQGMFAIDAIAHGEGPECVADCVRQDFQWARSMTNIMLRYAPRLWLRLSTRAKLRLGFCQVWYPLISATMLATVVLPVWSLFTHHPLVRVTLASFYLHLLPCAAAGIGALILLKRRDLFRPAEAPVISWEAPLFQLVRWPWVFLGCLEAVVGALVRREFDFKVTPKGRDQARPPSVLVLLPYLVLAGVSLLPAVLITNAGAAGGYYFWSLVNGLLYLGVSIAIVALDAHDARHTARRWRLPSFASTNAFAIAAVIAAVVIGASLHAHQAVDGVIGSPGPSPRAPLAARASLATPPPRAPLATPASYPIAASPRLSIKLGVSTQAMANNTLIAWKPSSLSQVNRFEHDAHAHADIVQWFVDWAHNHLSLEQLRAVGRRGSTPEIDWEPWNATKPEYHRQPRFSLASIIAGRHDAYIRSVARELKAYAKPVLLRFAQEMNGTWYPWSATGTKGTAKPGAYSAAWRHVHDIFSAVGAKNVLWVWSPVSGRIPARLYPGKGYVDVIGVSGFNGGSTIPSWGGWRTFPSLVGKTAAYLHHLHPSKPIQVSEVGSTESGGSKARWIAQMFRTIKHHRYISSVVWFNVTSGFFDYVLHADWPIDSSHSAAAAFAAGLRTLAVSRRHRSRLDGRR